MTRGAETTVASEKDRSPRGGRASARARQQRLELTGLDAALEPGRSARRYRGFAVTAHKADDAAGDNGDGDGETDDDWIRLDASERSLPAAVDAAGDVMV